MARRNRKQKQKIIRERQKKYRPAERYAEAYALALQGHFEPALDLAQAAQQAANDVATIQKTSVLIAELHFRLACQESTLQQRLSHLEAGELLAPDDPRFPRHRGALLLVLQQPEAALQALTRAREIVPTDPDIDILLTFAKMEWKPTSVPDAVPEQLETALEVMAAAARGNLTERAIDESTLLAMPGDDPAGWRALLTMAVDPTSSPLAGITDSSLADAVPLATPLLDYYAGIAALRRADHSAAVAAWQSAHASGLDTPWFERNQLYWLRQSAEKLANEDAWSDVVDLLQDEMLVKEDSALQELLGHAYFHIGKDAANAGRWPQAAAHWRRANELSPSRKLAQNLALAEESNENWSAAAQAWRDMVRRRPRKADHPDYLNDVQVATIWKRAAYCYEKAYDANQALVCLAKAIDYAPDNLEWAMELVHAYLYEERIAAAEQELLRILDVDADHLQALLELAELYDSQRDRDSIPIWRRAVAVDKTSEVARDGLAHALVERAKLGSSVRFIRLVGGNARSTIKQLEQAQVELPGHPLLLFELGIAFANQGKKAKARAQLIEASRSAAQRPSDNLALLGKIMHELLHVDGGDQVTDLTALIKPIPNLRATYWLEQADRVLSCDLGWDWADRFWQEAIDLAQRRPKPDTPAFTLLRILNSIADEILDQGEVAEQWLQHYVDLIDPIAPNRGLSEFAEALRTRNRDIKKTKRLLRRGKRSAQAAGEEEIVDYIEVIETMMSMPPGLADLLENFDEDDFASLLDSLEDDESLLDIFRQRRL